MAAATSLKSKSIDQLVYHRTWLWIICHCFEIAVVKKCMQWKNLGIFWRLLTVVAVLFSEEVLRSECPLQLVDPSPWMANLFHWTDKNETLICKKGIVGHAFNNFVAESLKGRKGGHFYPGQILVPWWRIYSTSGSLSYRGGSVVCHSCPSSTSSSGCGKEFFYLSPARHSAQPYWSKVMNEIEFYQPWFMISWR